MPQRTHISRWIELIHVYVDQSTFLLFAGFANGCGLIARHPQGPMASGKPVRKRLPIDTY